MIFNVLLIIHILSGSTSLACATAAIATQKGSHRHKRFGRYFFYGMTGIFSTALPMAYIKTNLFLFLVAVFSYYLAYSGWRYARRHTQTISKSDWLVCLTMLTASLIMVVIGLYKFNTDIVRSTVLIIFGLLGLSFSFDDAKLYYQGTISNTKRIAKHLQAMLGGTIATCTAFLVTVIHFGPPIILWLGPTVVFTPIIIYWTRKVEQKNLIDGGK
jgi:hypothetical protein